MVWCSAPNAFVPNGTETISVLFGSVRADVDQYTAAWQSGILAYREWLRSQDSTPFVTPQKMLAQEGMMQVCLECAVQFNLSALNESWHAWRDKGYGRESGAASLRC